MGAGSYLGVAFAITLFLNMMLGYLRRGAPRFSLKWFVLIHLAVPVVVLMRIVGGLDLKVVPLLVLASVIGQVAGNRVQGR